MFVCPTEYISGRLESAISKRTMVNEPRQQFVKFAETTFSACFSFLFQLGKQCGNCKYEYAACSQENCPKIDVLYKNSRKACPIRLSLVKIKEIKRARVRFASSESHLRSLQHCTLGITIQIVLHRVDLPLNPGTPRSSGETSYDLNLFVCYRIEVNFGCIQSKVALILFVTTVPCEKH